MAEILVLLTALAFLGQQVPRFKPLTASTTEWVVWHVYLVGIAAPGIWMVWSASGFLKLACGAVIMSAAYSAWVCDLMTKLDPAKLVGAILKRYHTKLRLEIAIGRRFGHGPLRWLLIERRKRLHLKGARP